MAERTPLRGHGWAADRGVLAARAFEQRQRNRATTVLSMSLTIDEIRRYPVKSMGGE